MKKRLLCLFIAVMLLVGLMPSAFAEGNIITYTVKSGDMIETICESAKIDYYKCRNCIMKINGFYSYDQLERIYVGQKIKLPASVEISAKIMSGELDINGNAPETKPVTPPAPETPTTPTTTEYKTISHTVGEWDTLISVCGKYGMNFYNVKYAIMKLNGFTSESQLDRLRNGQVVKLPASEADAKLVMSSGTATPTPTPTPTPGTTTGDRVAYYLVPYTFQPGDTVYNICRSMGIDFDKNSELIKKLNNISDYRAIADGKQLVLPSSAAPAAGSYYKIIAHKIVSGETTESIAAGLGQDHAKILGLMKTLNGRDNLEMIYAGATLYVPVACKA